MGWASQQELTSPHRRIRALVIPEHRRLLRSHISPRQGSSIQWYLASTPNMVIVDLCSLFIQIPMHSNRLVRHSLRRLLSKSRVMPITRKVIRLGVVFQLCTIAHQVATSRSDNNRQNKRLQAVDAMS